MLPIALRTSVCWHHTRRRVASHAPSQLQQRQQRKTFSISRAKPTTTMKLETTSNHCELLHTQYRSSLVNPRADSSATGRDRPKHSSYIGQIHSWGHFLLAVWKSWITLPTFRGFSMGHVAKRNPSRMTYVWFRSPCISPQFVRPVWEIGLWNMTNLCCLFCSGKWLL